MRNIRQNLFFALIYNALGVPIAAGVLYPISSHLAVEPDACGRRDEFRLRLGDRQCVAIEDDQADMTSVQLADADRQQCGRMTAESDASDPSPHEPAEDAGMRLGDAIVEPEDFGRAMTGSASRWRSGASRLEEHPEPRAARYRCATCCRCSSACRCCCWRWVACCLHALVCRHLRRDRARVAIISRQHRLAPLDACRARVVDAHGHVPLVDHGSGGHEMTPGEHFGQEFQGQADHVRFAPSDDRETLEPVLQAERARPCLATGRSPDTRRSRRSTIPPFATSCGPRRLPALCRAPAIRTAHCTHGAGDH